MQDLLPVVASGLVSASAFALIGLATVIIFGATDVVNIATGQMGMVGVLMAARALGSGIPVSAAPVDAAVVSGLFGLVMSWKTLREGAAQSRTTGRWRNP